MFPFYSNVLSNPNFHSELYTILKHGKQFIEHNEIYNVNYCVDNDKINTSKINIIHFDNTHILKNYFKNKKIIYMSYDIYNSENIMSKKQTYDLFCSSIYNYYKYIRNQYYYESSIIQHMENILHFVELNIPNNTFDTQEQFKIALHLIDKTPNTLFVISKSEIYDWEIKILEKYKKNIVLVNVKQINTNNINTNNINIIHNNNIVSSNTYLKKEYVDIEMERIKIEYIEIK
jgi:hypothetical protein